MGDNTDYTTQEILDQADHILSSICHELDLAESASAPYPLDDDYLNWMLEDTFGLVWWHDDERCWTFTLPGRNKALQLIAAHSRNSAGS
jgi:hypothetical protein